MSKHRVEQRSCLPRLGFTLALGLLSLIGLLMALNDASPPRAVLAEGPTIRYVAPAPVGSDDSNDCTDSGAPCATLQYAVDEADPGDEVRAASGTYTSTAVNVVRITKDLTLIGGYAPPDWSTPISHTSTRIDGERARRGIETEGMISVTLASLMVTRGKQSWSGGLWQRTGRSRLEIRNARFEDNVLSTTLQLDQGGALRAQGTILLYDTEVISNYAPKMCGGLYLASNATLVRTQVLSNTTERIGGGLCAVGGLTVIDSVFEGNAALTPDSLPHYGGGAIWLDDEAVATIRGTRIVGNHTTRRGGGLHIQNSDLTMINSVVADNDAAALGSGLYIIDSAVHLVHTTLARNQGGDGSGIHVSGPGSTVALTNTILVRHTVGITVAAGSTATLEATLWGAGAWANLTDWDGAGTILIIPPNLWGDPAFVDPDAGDYHIWYSSAATDAGIPCSVVEDIDGDARPMCLRLSDCQVDLGADEYYIWKVYLPLVLNDLRQGGAH